MFEGFSDAYDESARLAILRSLAEQPDYRLTDSMIDDLLVTRYAINRGRGYIRSQIEWLESQASAVKSEQSGTVIICSLTETGADHVLLRRVLPGIKRPGARRI
jgi:hypothetical protein